MEASGLDVVRRYRELLVANQFAEALELLADDVEFVSPQGTLGRAELEAIWSEPDPGYDHLDLEVVDVGTQELPDGRCLSQSDWVYRWKETKEVSNVERRAMLYEPRNGKIRWMKFFVSPAAAWAESGFEAP